MFTLNQQGTIPIGSSSVPLFGPILIATVFSMLEVLTCRGLLKWLPFWLFDFHRFSVSDAQFVTADRSMHGGIPRIRAYKRARSWRLLLVSICILKIAKTEVVRKSCVVTFSAIFENTWSAGWVDVYWIQLLKNFNIPSVFKQLSVKKHCLFFRILLGERMSAISGLSKLNNGKKYEQIFDAESKLSLRYAVDDVRDGDFCVQEVLSQTFL